MRKLLAILLAALTALSCAAAETATPGQALGEGEMLFHSYVSNFGGYGVGVPAEWALIGAESPLEYISQANEIADAATVAEIRKGLSENNDILIAVSAAGENMVLTYGASEGADNTGLVDEMEAFQKELSAAYAGIVFTDDSGSYKLNELTEILYIGANYQGHAIRQYYLAAGENLYIFTFTGVSQTIAEAVLSTFNLL